MSSLLLGTSILAAFFGGILALFAPCCITFLLPSYFASAFKEKTTLLKMTFFFAAGIAIIIVPISLGLTALSALFNQFHKEIFTLGGLFLIVLGVLSFLGKNLPIPMISTSLPKERNAFSVFTLGLFSGTASSCCAPVLAGVLTLTALSPSYLYTILISFAYVLGIVAPLFVLALLGDRFNLTKSTLLRGKRLQFNFGQKTFSISSNNLLAGILFISMGILVLYLGLTGKNNFAPEFQVSIGRYLTDLSNFILKKARVIPDPIVAIILLAVVVYLVRKAFFNKAQKEK